MMHKHLSSNNEMGNVVPSIMRLQSLRGFRGLLRDKRSLLCTSFGVRFVFNFTKFRALFFAHKSQGALFCWLPQYCMWLVQETRTEAYERESLLLFRILSTTRPHKHATRAARDVKREARTHILSICLFWPLVVI